MNKFDITNLGGHPLTGDDIAFLQNALREGIMSTMQDQVNTPVVLSGCVFTNPTTGLWNWTAGLVYYNGNIYNLAAGTATISGIQYLNWAFNQSNMPAGDVAYEDGSTQHTYIANIASVVVNTTANDMRATMTYYQAIKKEIYLQQGISDFTFHTGTHTMASLTTPDDGVTRNYLIEITVGLNQTSNSSCQADCQAEIRLHGGAQLDKVELQAWTGTGIKNVSFSASLRIIQSLPPNTQIDFNSIAIVSNGGDVQVTTGLATMRQWD